MYTCTLYMCTVQYVRMQYTQLIITSQKTNEICTHTPDLCVSRHPNVGVEESGIDGPPPSEVPKVNEVQVQGAIHLCGGGGGHCTCTCTYVPH